MNDLPTLPDPAVSSAAAEAAPSVPPAPVRGKPDVSLFDTLQQPQMLLIGVVVLALLLAGQTWSSSVQVRKLRQEMALRLQKGDSTNANGTIVSATGNLHLNGNGNGNGSGKPVTSSADIFNEEKRKMLVREQEEKIPVYPEK